MKDIAWSRILSVGVDEIDDDHRRLIAIFNEFNRAATCGESADYLGHERLLPQTHEGDVLLIATAGAYGHAMSSWYNMREPACEVMI